MNNYLKLNKLYIFVFFLFAINLYSKNYFFIDYYPDIQPVKKFINDFVNYINNINPSSTFICVKDKKIFSTSKEILNALQANIIQLAVIPAYTINTQLNNSLKGINFYNSQKINNSYTIPYREKLRNYGLFLLDIYYLGKYSIFSKKKLKNKNNILGSFFYINKFKNKFHKIVLIDETTNIKGLIKNNIIDSVLLTSNQFYIFNLFDTNLKFNYSIKGMYSYLIVLANNSFWEEINFNEKSILWSFITNYHPTFQGNFSKFNIYVKNLLYKKLLFLKF